MRFQLAFFSSAMLMVLANAQNSTSAETTPAVPVAASGTAAMSPAQSSQAACLDACSPTDPACRNACILAPTGNYAGQNATIMCIDDCVQGNGTAADNLAFENCQKQCLDEASMTSAAASTSAAPTMAAGSAAGGSASGGVQTAAGGMTGSSAGAVATAGSSGSPSSTSSKSPAETLRVGISVAGVAGAFAAVLAL